MKAKEQLPLVFGLIGKNLNYSFSQSYFTKKFKKYYPHYSYKNYELAHISMLPKLLETVNLRGLNVTIPYKEEVIPFVDSLHEDAAKIGAVNTIKIDKKGSIRGYNTDWIGFTKSIAHLKLSNKTKALILGSGGASKAVIYALKKLGIEITIASRNPDKNWLDYSKINEEVITSHQMIVNCSPVGTFPKINEKPNLPYEYLKSSHVLYDLVYNPSETAFLKEGIKKNTTVINGLSMLEVQAEASWDIWSSLEVKSNFD